MSKTPLPHSEEAESAALACVLMDPQHVLAKCAERKITPAHFYLPGNELMFAGMVSIWTRGANVDLATIAAELGPNFANAGGPVRIMELETFGAVLSAINDYLTIIQDRFTLRKVVEIGRNSALEAAEHGADGKNVLAGLLSALEGISVSGPKRPPTMKELLMEKFKRLERDEDQSDRIETGFPKLDRQSPLKRGLMPLLTGERKAGKSMFALNVAVNVAEMKRHRVLYFSLEDPASEVIDRVMARMCKIPIIRHDKHSMSEIEMNQMQRSAQEMALMPMDIRDDSFDLMSIVSATRQYKAQYPDLGLVVVDYAQLVRVPTTKGQNREQEVATVSRTLRLLSMDLKVALLLLCQINKDGETRESKALEQDCTAMWKVTTPDVEKPSEKLLYIPFQRNGESNIAVPLLFQGHIANFETRAITGETE